MSNNVTLPGTGVLVDTIDTSTNGTTNGTTAAGAAVLNFAATPANVSVGMVVTDTTAPTVIPSNTTVLSFTATTVTMSANATGAGVGNGDTIHFAGGERQRVAIGPADGSNVDIFGVPSQAAVIT